MSERPRPRIPLGGVTLAAAVGILAADWWPLSATACAVGALGLLLWILGGRAGWPVLATGTALAFAALHGWQWREDPSRLFAGAFGPEPWPVEVTGVVSAEPQRMDPGQGPGAVWQFPLRTVHWERAGKRETFATTVSVRVKSDQPPAYGDLLALRAAAQTLSPPRNPGEFDFARWMHRSQIYLQLRPLEAGKMEVLARGAGNPLVAAALRVRRWMERTLTLGLEGSPEIAAVIAGLTLGTRDQDGAGWEDAFRQTGTLHLFSVSGLHVGMFAALLWCVLRPLGLSRRQAVAVILPMLFFYALVTGARPASVRAATMIAIALGGFLLNRPPAVANSLAAAALVLLAQDTNQLFLAGFQLSFGVVAALMLLAGPLRQVIVRRLQPDPFLPAKLRNRSRRLQARWSGPVADGLAISGAAWLGGLPLTVAHFHMIPLLAVPANLLAVPAAFVILATSMLALTGGLLSSWLAAVFNNANWAFTSALVGLLQAMASWPGAYVHVGWPSALRPSIELTIFDAGDGGAVVLRTRGGTWLIDAGSAADFDRFVGPYLMQAGVNRLAGLVLTHGDAAHTGGAKAALLRFRPEAVWESTAFDRSPHRRAVREMLAATGHPPGQLKAGDRLAVGPDSSMDVLFPPEGWRRARADDQSLVLRISAPGLRVLLMQDSGLATEEWLRTEAAASLPCDILVLGRHGTDLHATSAFLKAAAPRLIVQAAPDPFDRGAGRHDASRTLGASGASVFLQENCGAVLVTLRGDAWQARGWLGAPPPRYPPAGSR